VTLPTLRHANVSLLRRLESLELAGDRVDARVDEIEDVVAVLVSRRTSRDASRVVPHRDVAPGSAPWVESSTETLDATAIVLGAGRRRGEQQMTDERDQEHR
jgi:hypothetical protein